MNGMRPVAVGLSVLCAAVVPCNGGQAKGRPGNTPIAELSIEFEKNLPLVSLRVNGSPLTLILDSASRDCVIDAAAAADSGIQADTSALTSGSGGMVAVKLARGVQVRQAGVEVDLEYAVVTNLDHLRFKRPIHGVARLPLFCKPFVDRHRLLDRMKGLEKGSTLGLGGGSPDMVGRIDSVAVGPFVVRDPEVRFSTATSGSFASTRFFSANLGNSFLNRYTVTFDLRNSRLIVTP